MWKSFKSMSLQSEKTDKPKYEVADILDIYWGKYIKAKPVPPHIANIVSHIRNCRTAEMGYHKISCTNKDCDHVEISHNSCRNRHCPKCQGSKQIEWVHNRLKELLPVPYFHTIFTLPHTLNYLALFNQEVVYDLFFKATSFALNQFALDHKYLGGQTGFFGILHTWGQNLSYHVHIHYIVAGCGLLKDKTVKRLPYQEKFLFPVKAMSKTVRSHFIKGLKKAYYNLELYLPGQLQFYSDIDEFEKFCNDLGKEAWVCYSKPPFSGPDKVVQYISRYTHRVAIANSRIQSIDNGKIRFSYKDYKDDYKIKEMELP